MILLFIRGFLHVLLDLDSVGITKIVAAWLHGFDPIAVEGGHRLPLDQSQNARLNPRYNGL